MHMILTVFVARTLFPQQGHCSFLVLLGALPPDVTATPCAVPPPGVPIRKPLTV